jgi:hypothetical protein
MTVAAKKPAERPAHLGPVVVMRSVQEFDEWVQAEEKLTSLREQLAEVQKRKVEIENTPQKSFQVDAARVEELLRTGKLPPDCRRPLQQEYEELDSSERVFVAAIERQETELRNVLVKCSKRASEEEKPRHMVATLAVLEALHALMAANDEEIRVRDGLTRGGLNCYLPALCFTAGGKLSAEDVHSSYSLYLRELRNSGYLRKDHPLWQDLKTRHGLRDDVRLCDLPKELQDEIQAGQKRQSSKPVEATAWTRLTRQATPSEDGAGRPTSPATAAAERAKQVSRDAGVDVADREQSPQAGD